MKSILENNFFSINVMINANRKKQLQDLSHLDSLG